MFCTARGCSSFALRAAERPFSRSAKDLLFDWRWRKGKIVLFYGGGGLHFVLLVKFPHCITPRLSLLSLLFESARDVVVVGGGRLCLSAQQTDDPESHRTCLS